MHKFSLRVSSLVQNIRTLSPLLGGPHVALFYILRTKGKLAATQEGRYKNIPFQFRRCDLSAVSEIFFKQEYGSFLEGVLRSEEKPVIRDIGAHIGLFSIWAFSVNPRADIRSVEASPSTYKMLSANVSKNNFQWWAENKAAWGTHDHIAFADGSESTMSNRVDAQGSVEIQTLTLADVVAGQPIDLMKVDIEGAEESFLTTDDSPLVYVQNLVIELHPSYCNTQKVIDVLNKHFSKIINVKENTTSKPLLFCAK